MKINKGKIKNVSKKVLALGLTFTLIPVTFSGCTSIKDFDYATNEQGYIQGLSGTIRHYYLNECGFYEVTNNITGEKYYTILFHDSFDNCYYDLFTKQNVSMGEFRQSDRINSVEDYLIAYKMLKDEYKPEEIKWLLDTFIENQTKEKEKQLVKE